MLKLIFKPFTFIWKKFSKQSNKKKALIVVISLILFFVLNRVLNKPNPKHQYQLEAAVMASITEVVSETGNITTAGAAPMYSTTTGVVQEVFVSNGTIVNKGDSLFKVQSTATKQEKDTALANYLAAKTALETAQATQLSLQANMFSAWDSFKELAQGDQYENEDGTPKYNDRGVAEFHISEKEWLAAEASYKKQQAAISQAQASLSSSWQAYQATQDSEVVAILAGEVRNLGITKGDLVTAPSAVNLSSTPPALILLSSDVKTTIKLNIEETDIVKLKEGQSAQVEIDAFPNQLFPGKVDRVDTIAVPSNGIVTYSVYVSLDEHNNSLRSGMTADVSITVASKDNILTVPSSAVKPYEGGRAVRVVGENGEIKYLPVEIGSRGEGKTEIISGIQEGQEVIVALTNDQVERPGGLF